MTSRSPTQHSRKLSPSPPRPLTRPPPPPPYSQITYTAVLLAVKTNEFALWEERGGWRTRMVAIGMDRVWRENVGGRGMGEAGGGGGGCAHKHYYHHSRNQTERKGREAALASVTRTRQFFELNNIYCQFKFKPNRFINVRMHANVKFFVTQSVKQQLFAMFYQISL